MSHASPAPTQGDSSMPFEATPASSSRVKPSVTTFYLLSYPLNTMSHRVLTQKFMSIPQTTFALNMQQIADSNRLLTTPKSILWIYRREGWIGLYRGLGLCVLHLAAYDAMRFMLDWVFHQRLTRLLGSCLFSSCSISSSSTGCGTALLSTQSISGSGQAMSLPSTVLSTTKEALAPTPQPSPPTSGVTTASSVSSLILKYVSHAATYPLLTIATRVVAYEGPERYNFGLRSCIQKTLAQEGFGGLYCGIWCFLFNRSSEDVTKMLVQRIARRMMLDESEEASISDSVNLLVQTALTPSLALAVVQRCQSTMPGLCSPISKPLQVISGLVTISFLAQTAVTAVFVTMNIMIAIAKRENDDDGRDENGDTFFADDSLTDS